MKKIKNFSQHINEAKAKIAKMSSLITPTDQEIEDAEKYLEQGSDSTWDLKDGYFYIDISGKHSVYYTLWKTNLYNGDKFITNLSTDFQTAVEKAKKASGRIPVIIDRLGTKAGLFQAAKAEILTFGKHRGKTIGDVFVEDPQYVVWLSKNDKGKSEIMTDKIKYYTGLYFETLKEKNQKESKSQFVGNIGEKITIIADVTMYNSEPGNFNNIQHVCKLIDDDGNKYMTALQSIHDKTGCQQVYVKGFAVKCHQEFLLAGNSGKASKSSSLFAKIACQNLPDMKVSFLKPTQTD